MRLRDNAAVKAIVKQPACAAPINSSGLVADCPSSNSDLNEYGPSNAPLPTFNLPLPSARFPSHCASAFRTGISLLSIRTAMIVDLSSKISWISPIPHNRDEQVLLLSSRKGKLYDHEPSPSMKREPT